MPPLDAAEHEGVAVTVLVGAAVDDVGAAVDDVADEGEPGGGTFCFMVLTGDSVKLPALQSFQPQAKVVASQPLIGDPPEGLSG